MLDRLQCTLQIRTQTLNLACLSVGLEAQQRPEAAAGAGAEVHYIL